MLTSQFKITNEESGHGEAEFFFKENGNKTSILIENITFFDYKDICKIMDAREKEGYERGIACAKRALNKL